mgnify:CR=1 FL=1
MAASETTDRPSLQHPHKASLKSRIEENVLWVSLFFIATGFISGAGGFRWVIDATNQTIVLKASCIPIAEIAGKILRREAVREIDFTIETGRGLAGKNKENKGVNPIV